MTAHRKFSYMALYEVSLGEIFDKYAHKDLSLLQFRQRVYSGQFTMRDALTKPPANRTNEKKFSKIFTELYNKYKPTAKRLVGKPNFIIKMTEGYAPEVAINRKEPPRKPIPKLADLVVKKPKAKLKVIKAEPKPKLMKPFNREELDYIDHINVVDMAFGKIKHNKAQTNGK